MCGYWVEHSTFKMQLNAIWQSWRQRAVAAVCDRGSQRLCYAVLFLCFVNCNLGQKLLRQVPRSGIFTFLCPWNAPSPPPSAQCCLPVSTMSLAVSPNRNNIERRGREDLYWQNWENTTGLVLCLNILSKIVAPLFHPRFSLFFFLCSESGLHCGSG